LNKPWTSCAEALVELWISAARALRPETIPTAAHFMHRLIQLLQPAKRLARKAISSYPTNCAPLLTSTKEYK
jgi:hypothetical protein